MSVEERFYPVLSSVEIELASSLPICTHEKEILFFYSTLPYDNESFLFDEIKHVFFRDIKTGSISEEKACSIIDKELINKLHNSIIRPTLFDDAALDAEDNYYNCYEQFYEFLTDGSLKPSNKYLFKELLCLFNSIVPDPVLKELYYHIGAEFFDCLGD